MRRLWHFLVTKKILHDLFIRYIFKKKTLPPPPLAVYYFVAFYTLISLCLILNVKNFKLQTGNIDYTTQTSSGKKLDYADSIMNASSSALTSSSYKIVHKDQETIHGFCLYEVINTFWDNCPKIFVKLQLILILYVHSVRRIC